MFSSAEARYVLRAAVATVLAFLAALATAITDGGVSMQEWVAIAIATVTVVGAYLGIGAGVPQVEPFIGNKLEPAPVPPEGDQAGT